SGLILGSLALNAADILVETPGGQFQFLFNGTNAATLTLVRGQTYTFNVQTSPNHPFQIQSPGVVSNYITSGVLSYTVPTNNASYTYSCGIHPWMYGDIFTIDPPQIRILGLTVGSNLVLSSTATNNWTVQPEYSTNLASTNWNTLLVQSNRITDGRLETFCGRPEGNPVFIRIRSSR
ncbi:MAG TPA: hypothetical protein VK968_05460, partial [Roseimicrobium sp.]|nr:hypothetical protein [Roseimicrobium sp.]